MDVNAAEATRHAALCSLTPSCHIRKQCHDCPSIRLGLSSPTFECRLYDWNCGGRGGTATFLRLSQTTVCESNSRKSANHAQYKPGEAVFRPILGACHSEILCDSSGGRTQRWRSCGVAGEQVCQFRGCRKRILESARSPPRTKGKG